MTMAGVKWFNIWVLTCMFNDHLKTKCASMAKVANLLMTPSSTACRKKFKLFHEKRAQWDVNISTINVGRKMLM